MPGRSSWPIGAGSHGVPPPAAAACSPVALPPRGTHRRSARLPRPPLRRQPGDALGLGAISHRIATLAALG
jgi:hypothetical protein